MASSSPSPESSKSENHTERVLRALYCTDPECPYCTDLRAAEQQWKSERDEQKNADVP